MGIKEKIDSAVTSDWLTRGISDTELNSLKQLSRISVEIELRRHEMKMTQKQFAEYMGVSQGMISKWESGEYNFTIETLYSICEKLGLIFTPSIKNKTGNNIVDFQQINRSKKKISFGGMDLTDHREELIA